MTSNYRFVDQGHRKLRETVGTGKLRGVLVIDQVYAKYQHERTDLRHPRGGIAHYLRTALFTHYRDYLQNLADAVLEGRSTAAMARNMEALAGATTALTPLMFNNLRRSGHPKVYDHGRLVYDRRPQQRRLTKAELRHRGRRR